MSLNVKSTIEIDGTYLLVTSQTQSPSVNGPLDVMSLDVPWNHNQSLVSFILEMKNGMKKGLLCKSSNTRSQSTAFLSISRKKELFPEKVAFIFLCMRLIMAGCKEKFYQ